MLSSKNNTLAIKHFYKELCKSKLFVTASAIFLLTFAVYLNNLSSDVYAGDSGDLITAAVTKGVPHPSGYPLITMLGIAFTSLPFDATPAWKMGLTSTLFSSFSITLLFLIVYELTKKFAVSIITSLTLAFTYTFWLYSEVVEVFPLHSLFILLLILLSLKFYKSKKTKYIYLLSFITGLSLTNNLAIVLIYPAILFIILLTKPKIILNIHIILKCLVLFLLGLTPYVYIPIAAQNNPAINWDKAVNLTNFLWLVARRDYGWALTKGKMNIIFALKPYINYLRVYGFFPIIFVALLGSIHFMKAKKFKLLTFFFLMYILTGPVFFIWGHRQPTLSLSKHAIFERFYIISFIAPIILFAFGLLFLDEKLKFILKKNPFKNLIGVLVVATFSLIPLNLFIKNFKRTNLSNISIGSNIATDILSTLPRNSVFIPSADTAAFNCLYIQNVYNFRKDVLIPGRHGGLVKLLVTSEIISNDEAEEFAVKNKNAIGETLLNQSIAILLAEGHAIYSQKEYSTTTEYGNIVSIPYGLVYKLETESAVNKISKDTYINQVTSIWDSFHTDEFIKSDYIVSDNLRLSSIRGSYSLASINTAKYIYETYKDKETADMFIQKAKEIDPLVPEDVTYLAK